MGCFWGDFGPFLGRFVVILGSLWDQFGIVLASCWGVFVSFSHRFGNVLGPFWCVFESFGRCLGVFRPKTVILRGFRQKKEKKYVETQNPILKRTLRSIDP